jgi:hypothetical protein
VVEGKLVASNRHRIAAFKAKKNRMAQGIYSNVWKLMGLHILVQGKPTAGQTVDCQNRLDSENKHMRECYL